MIPLSPLLPYATVLTLSLLSAGWQFADAPPSAEPDITITLVALTSQLEGP